MAAKWQRIKYMPGTGIGKDGQRVTAGKEHIAIARQAACEGMVLLRNEGEVLPLKNPCLAVFGKASVDYVQGGGGSGDVYAPYKVSLSEALETEEKNGTLTFFHPLNDFYKPYVAAAYADGKHPGQVPEPVLPESLIKEAAAFTDTAVITLCRFSGEGWDRTGTLGDGDFYLSPEEKQLADTVTGSFKKVIVVLNIGGMMDTSWMREKTDAILLMGQPGMEGGLAALDVLLGRVTPSGHLTDTLAEDFQAYPSSEGFHDSPAYVEYTEDIFVGYRYFETVPGAKDKVVYPFGYGLSYTAFSWENETYSNREDGSLFRVTVKNTGKYAGKEVVQLYAQCPEGKLDKPKYVLTGFGKTPELQPGESCTLDIAFSLRDFASYSETDHAWVLEKGVYTFHAGRNVRDIKAIGELTLETDRILETVENRAAAHQLSKRLHSDGSFENLPTEEVPAADYLGRLVQDPGLRPREMTWEFQDGCGDGKGPTLDKVAEGKVSLDELLDCLTDEQLIHLLGGQPNRGCADTFGFGNIPKFNIPNCMTADGPAGLRIQPDRGVSTTAFPCATMLACTWNTDLIAKVGRAAAEELFENGYGIWLAPAMNIHRSPLCGRNFEYYSEDPLLSGRCAAAMVRGIQSMGIAATVKHFACNNKETNRGDSDSRVSERALREIYLKGFEIAVKEAQPWALMTSYNLVNGVRASENKDLLTGILRDEWGFEGVVTTDWYTLGGQYLEVLAGNDIKMGVGMPEHTLQMLREGRIDRETIRASARRVLELILRLA